MSQEIELTNISENQVNENVIVDIRTSGHSSCWYKNKSSILFLSAAAIGFLWVGLNIEGYI